MVCLHRRRRLVNLAITNWLLRLVVEKNAGSEKIKENIERLANRSGNRCKK